MIFLLKRSGQIIDRLNQVPAALFPELKSKLSCPALVTALAARLDQALQLTMVLCI